MYKIAIDIGGTNIKVAVINDDLEMIDYKRLKRQIILMLQIVDETYQLVAAFMKQYQLKNPFIGISSAGVVDSDLGQIIYTGPTIPIMTVHNSSKSSKIYRLISLFIMMWMRHC